MGQEYPFFMSAQFDDFNDQPIDLSQFDADYARAEVRPPDGGETIPDGQYEVKIEDARLTRTPRTNNPMILWKLRVLGPTHQGAALTKTRIITHKTLAFVKEDLELLGIRLDRFSELENYLGLTIDREIRIVKKVGNSGWTDIYFARSHAQSAAVGDSILFPGGGEPLPF
jgi:hypothetical protein